MLQIVAPAGITFQELEQTQNPIISTRSEILIYINIYANLNENDLRLEISCYMLLLHCQ